MAMLLVNGGEMSGSTGMEPRTHFSGRGRFIRVTANAKTKPSSTPARDTARARYRLLNTAARSYQFVKIRSRLARLNRPSLKKVTWSSRENGYSTNTPRDSHRAVIAEVRAGSRFI